MQPHEAEELARARLAYVSAGRRPLSAPRRALYEAEPAPPADDAPDRSSEAPPAAHPADPPPPAAPPRSILGWITPKHILVVAVLLLCSVGVAVAALSRSIATEVPVEPVPVQSAAPETSPSAPVMIRVHVAGAVVSPGVVSLPEGAIVQDAVTAAGGLTPEADPALLNLAAPLSEGMQIAIGTKDEPRGDLSTGTSGGGDGSQEAGGQLDLNTATAEQLEALPGIGPVTAQSIVAWREEHGRFTVVEELQEIGGIGPKTFQKLSPLVRVS